MYDIYLHFDRTLFVLLIHCAFRFRWNFNTRERRKKRHFNIFHSYALFPKHSSFSLIIYNIITSSSFFFAYLFWRRIRCSRNWMRSSCMYVWTLVEKNLSAQSVAYFQIENGVMTLIFRSFQNNFVWFHCRNWLID